MSHDHVLPAYRSRFSHAPLGGEVKRCLGGHALKMTRFSRAVVLWRQGHPWCVAWWPTSPHVCDLRHLAPSLRAHAPLQPSS
jgi:hypothetical protein